MARPRIAASFEEDWPRIASIEGWLSREQASALHAASAALDPGTWAVEIGSHHGRSTAALALGRAGRGPVLAIDPYPPRPLGHGERALSAFRENMRALGLERDVHLFNGTASEAARSLPMLRDIAAPEDSDSAAPPEIGLLFVDGLHDLNSVRRDIATWEPLVAEGGLIFFHDAFFRLGVTLALLQHHLLNFEFRYLGSVGNLAMFRRTATVRNREALGDSARLLGRLVYFARNLLTMIGLRRGWKPLLRAFPPEKDFEY